MYNNPTNCTQIFNNHEDYKKHLGSLFKTKSRLDNGAPKSMAFTHLRSKYYKQDLHQHRERRFENDNLVLRILKIRGRHQPDVHDEKHNQMGGFNSARASAGKLFTSHRKSDPNNMSTMQHKRSNSVRSFRS